MIFPVGIVLLLMQSLSPDAIEHAQAGSTAEKQGKFDLAIQEFKKVTELQPELATGYANLGDAYFRKGDYTQAIPILEHALRLSDGLRATHEILGVALLIQGDAAGALPHLEKAPVPELMGLAYLETGNAGNAVAALQIALKGQPDDADVLYYFGRATALASRQAFERLGGKQAGSEAQSDKGKGAIPDLAPLQAALAQRPDDREQLDQFAKSAALASALAFDQILEKHADSARAHQVAAERYVDEKKISEAEKEYATALSLQPYTAGVHLAFGKVLAAAGDLPHAIVEFRLESRIRPASAEGFYYAGTTLLQQGKASEALSELAHADQLNPNTPVILLALGKAASASGDAPRAEKAFTTLLAVDKTSDLATQAHAALENLKGPGKP